ncbi:hypothetical protein N752_08480 [Desulforamulus aquiferis]|nr:hypothetical protein N752_08480 [Desulforamulus aquiferis]
MVAALSLLKKLNIFPRNFPGRLGFLGKNQYYKPGLGRVQAVEKDTTGF